MRLWSIHPSYLDAKGLVALWREALLAKTVLENKTKGYRNHPQLNRFKKTKSPVNSIRHYLIEIHKESVARGYNFDKSKIGRASKQVKLKVTHEQINYEAQHLLKKLKIRDRGKYLLLESTTNFSAHPLFRIIRGKIEDWEIIK
jgi:hypothetical protein